MKHVKFLLIELEKFVASNPDGEDGVYFARQNLKSMFLASLKNPENESETPALHAETFLFLDEILQALNNVTADELSRIQAMID